MKAPPIAEEAGGHQMLFTFQTVGQLARAPLKRWHACPNA
jgi:hypothetical protein